MSKRALDDFSTFRPAPRVEKRGKATRACSLFNNVSMMGNFLLEIDLFSLFIFFAQIQTNVSMQLVPRRVKVGKTVTTAEQNPRPCTRGVRSRVTCVDQVRFCRTKPCILTCAACKEIQVYKTASLCLWNVFAVVCGIYIII